MIDTEALRKKIIELAIQGKLTQQLPEDGNAEDLYTQIQEERARLIKEGKIKKDKPLPEISDDEIPFEIPNNWKFVRFSTIISLQSGQDLNSSEYNNDNNGIPYITGASNYGDEGTVIINRWTDSPKAIALQGDILLSCKGTVGKIAILGVPRVHIARQIMGIRTYSMNVMYIRYFIERMVDGIKEASKGLIPGIERNDVLRLCCPIPPLSEQERIVNVIETAINELDTIDVLQQQYESDCKILKGKIIDAGIRGKLTQQLPEDGNAETLRRDAIAYKESLVKNGVLKNRKNKFFKEVGNEDCLFELPSSWRWFRLGEVTEVFGRIGFRGYKKTDLVPKGHGAITLSPSNISKYGEVSFENSTYISWDKYEESPEIMLEEGDVVLVKTGSTYGKCGIVNMLPEKATINPQLAILKYIKCNRKYLYYVLRSTVAWSQFENFVVGAATPTFSQERLSNMLIPMPPLREQSRIVSTIDAFFEW